MKLTPVDANFLLLLFQKYNLLIHPLKLHSPALKPIFLIVTVGYDVALHSIYSPHLAYNL